MHRELNPRVVQAQQQGSRGDSVMAVAPGVRSFAGLLNRYVSRSEATGSSQRKKEGSPFRSSISPTYTRLAGGFLRRDQGSAPRHT